MSSSSVDEALPMFPLGTVLLPTAPLPLHVFEPRYQALVADCLAAPSPEFGVVLIERGSEVGGDDVRTARGCVARLLAAHELGGGRWQLVAVGTDRFDVVRWLPDDPYPKALIRRRLSATAPPNLATDGTVARLRRLLALRAELGEAVAPIDVALEGPPVAVVWQAAALAGLTPLDLQGLLDIDDPVQLRACVDDLLDDAAELAAARLGRA